MMLSVVSALFLGMVAQTASPPPSVPATGDSFIADARALVERGPGAENSPEADQLRVQMGAAGAALRARVAAEKAAGKPMLACLPAPGQASLNLGQIMSGIAALTPAQRAGPLNDAFALVLASIYPCPAKL